MKHIAFDLKRTTDRSNITERGELMRYFCSRINSSRAADGLPPVTMGRMGKLLQQIPTKDLYYLQSVCDKAGNFSKKFWYEMNPQKFQDRQGNTVVGKKEPRHLSSERSGGEWEINPKKHDPAALAAAAEAAASAPKKRGRPRKGDL